MYQKMKQTLSNKDYHAHPALGSSTLKGFLDNPVLAYNRYLRKEKTEPTPAMVFGSLVHTLTLEPHLLEKEYCIIPDHLCTASGVLSKSKLAIEELEKLTCKGEKPAILKEILEGAEKIANIAKNYKFELSFGSKVVRFTIDDIRESDQVEFEPSYFCKIDGIELKCRPDMLIHTDQGAIVIDLKTAEESTQKSFIRASVNFRYHVQEEHYRTVLAENGIKVLRFLFLVVGKKDKTAQQYEFLPSTRELAQSQWLKAFNQFKKAKEGNLSNAPFEDNQYNKEVLIDLPTYAFYD